MFSRTASVPFEGWLSLLLFLPLSYLILLLRIVFLVRKEWKNDSLSRWSFIPFFFSASLIMGWCLSCGFFLRKKGLEVVLLERARKNAFFKQFGAEQFQRSLSPQQLSLVIPSGPLLPSLNFRKWICRSSTWDSFTQIIREENFNRTPLVPPFSRKLSR